MEHQDAAKKLSELGHTTRLAIYRLLVKSGPEGLSVSDLQAQLDIPGSTLSHHISRLVNSGLMVQKRQGRVLLCVACFPALMDLVNYLLEECCTTPDQGSNGKS
ncbi:helix-turn-helix domain-containing protein [Microbulbifer sp. OS29]|uniref:Helix-turn-helix domain-containing protein n=1 Tax=Microbulbifer okhotskensis TaxID=2926617 RepID=A0A9X2EU96_9GAMM|nr:helix-turn-helix domain-containing protein [Microbulbifer okhotskensis]MCO1335963.1 helix-turn-helix domain-containing protein [Microbulbifer okhotskensis]